MKNIFRLVGRSKLLFVVFCLLTTMNRLHAQWIQTNGIYGGDISSLAVSGTNLFAGISDGGVFLSTNNGASWSAASTGLTNTYVHAIAVSGTNLFAGTGGGVFLSTNNGTSWTVVNTGLTNTSINALVVSGTNLFAGTYGGGVFLSTNNGASWTVAKTGLNNYVYALAVSGTNLFAGADGGVFLSTNNGTSWSAVSTGLTNTYIRALAVSGTNLFAGTGGGVFLSTNNGTSWTVVNTGLTNTSINALAVSGANLFAGTSVGVFLSTNNGTDWSAASTGLTSTIVRALVVSGTNLFAGTSGGVFLSTNNGTGWSAASTGLTSTIVRALVVSGTNLFAGTSGGVFLSTNNGTSWSAASTGLTNTSINALAISGTNLFAGTYIGGGSAFLSTNNGTTWSLVTNGLGGAYVNALAVSFNGTGDTNLFAGTFYGGVCRSTNNGTNWTSINTGLPEMTTVYSLAVSGTNLFAGTDAGVFLSTNNGTSWSAANTPFAGFSTMVQIITNLFAGTSSGVFLSTNDGTSWTAINNGLTNTAVRALAVSGTNLFAGTSGGGVFFSTNNGTSWTNANNGLTNTYVSDFAVSGTNLFAGTSGGVFQLISPKAALSPPTLNSPSNGVYLVGPPYTFRWHAVSNAGGYQLRIAYDTSFTSPIINDQNISGSATSYTTSTNLTDEQTYYWQMRTLDSSGTQWWGDWSQYKSFVAIQGNSSYHVHLNFIQENVTSVIFNYSNGFLIGITSNWSSTNNSFSSDIVLNDNESKNVNGSYTIVLKKIDSTQVSVALQPHNLTVSCTGGGTYYGSYWYSKSEDTITVNSSIWYYYKTGSIRERIYASVTSLTGISSSLSGAPKRFTLEQNYPNPFNPTTNISFYIPKKSFVSVTIFDILGREVEIIVSKELSAGNYTRQWNANGMPSGVYFYRLQAGSFTETKKLVLLR